MYRKMPLISIPAVYRANARPAIAKAATEPSSSLPAAPVKVGAEVEPVLVPVAVGVIGVPAGAVGVETVPLVGTAGMPEEKPVGPAMPVLLITPVLVQPQTVS